MKEKIKNFILIVLIIIFCISLSPITMQNDTYYTIAIGEHILENGIDMQDPFSLHENLPYTYPHWGYDVATYLIYNVGNIISGEIGGYIAIYVSTIILASMLGILVYRTNKRIVKNTIISFVITLLAIYSVRDYIAARAQLVTFILFIFEVYYIEMFLEKSRKRYIIGLIFIPIIIANLHVAVWWFYFILYIPYIAEYIIAKISKKNNEIILSRIEISKNKNIKYLIITMIICLFTGLLTPLGDTAYTYLIKTMQGNTTENINEHLPMTIMQHAEPLVALGILIFVLTCTRAKIKLRDVFMIFGLILLMLYSRRQQSLFFLVGSIIFNKIFSQILEDYKEGGIKILDNALLSKISIAVISLIVVAISVYFIIQKDGNTFVSKSTYPVEASEWILENLDLEKIRLFNEYNYGSYLLYKGIPVFIDSRADLYAPEFNTTTGKSEDGRDIFTDFIDASHIDIFYEDIFEKYKITHVILYQNSKMNLIITNINDGTYNCIYEDDNFVLYEIKEKVINMNLLGESENR